MRRRHAGSLHLCQPREQLTRTRRTAIRRALQRRDHDVAKQLRNLGAVGRRLRRERIGLEPAKHAGHVVALSGKRTREQFEEDHAGRVDVRPHIEVVPEQLLRRHVGWSTHHAAGARQPRAVAAARWLGDAEVDQLHHLGFAGRDDHVVGLEIAVQDLRGMQRVEAAQDATDDEERLAPRQRSTTLHPRAEVFALDELHHDAGQARGRRAEVCDRHNVGVADAGHQGRLPFKPPHHVVVHLGEDLDGHRHAEPVVTRPIDLAHPTPAEHRLDAVAT